MIWRGAVLAVVLLAARSARADDNVEKADELFDQGRALMNTDLHAACEKFEESLKWNSQAIGTLMNVALCDEKLGRTASAYAKFTEARDRAREGGMESHRKAAEEKLRELKGKVPHVVVRFARPPVDGTKIVLGDRVIPTGVAGDIPIDPGEHVLVVSAPGHVAYEHQIRIAEGERREVDVPGLATAIVRSSRRAMGKVLAISGGSVAASGVIIGLLAARRYNRAVDAHCDDVTHSCDNAGLTDTQNARTLAHVGTVVGFVGLAAAGVGVYLWLRSPRESDRRVSVLPQLDPTTPGLAVAGRF